MTDDIPVTQPGAARCPQGDSWEDIVADDTRPLPAFLARESYQYLGSEPLASARYTSEAFFEAEKERMWPQVWQYAARDEDMPNPGDYVVYNNVGRSFLIVRQDDGSVRAFYNACRHRGRQLRSEGGSASEFRCSFHGWTYNTDGTIKDIPCRWDFPSVTDEDAKLDELSAGRWDGYIFVRESATGPTLEEFLDPLPTFFKRWPHEECYTVVNVGKIIHANWKATSEAFMETYHAPETHPQLKKFVGDINAFYGMWGDNVNLDLTPFARPHRWWTLHNNHSRTSSMNTSNTMGAKARRWAATFPKARLPGAPWRQSPVNAIRR